MRYFVIIRTSFEGIHRWTGCSILDVSFLRNNHRHIFHVEAKAEVNHTDRDIEFIMEKRKIDQYLSRFGTEYMGNMSCEDVGVDLLNEFPELCSVKIFEDNENGAEVVR